MTDRFHSLTVVLDKDIRSDDIQPLIDAIGLFPHVLTVQGEVSDNGAFMAQIRARSDMSNRLYKILADWNRD